LDHAEHLTFKLSFRKVIEWEIPFIAFVIATMVAALTAFASWNLEVVAFLFFAATHEFDLLAVLNFFSIFILVSILIVVNAFGLSLATKHSCLHISFLLISLSLHLLQEVLPILLLEDTTCLFLLMI
jgi:hypothetical protein